MFSQAPTESSTRPDAGDAIPRRDPTKDDVVVASTQGEADLAPTPQQQDLLHLAQDAIASSSAAATADVTGASALAGADDSNNNNNMAERKGQKRAHEASADVHSLPLSRSDMQPSSKKEKILLDHQLATGACYSSSTTAMAVRSAQQAVDAVGDQGGACVVDIKDESIRRVSDPEPENSGQTPGHHGVHSAPVSTATGAAKYEDEATDRGESKGRENEGAGSAATVPGVSESELVGGGDSATVVTTIPGSAAKQAADPRGREELLESYATKLDALWINNGINAHHANRAFHRARALMELTSLDEATVRERTGISNMALSQYLRGQYQGSPDYIESKFNILYDEFIQGKHAITIPVDGGTYVNGEGDIPMVAPVGHDVYEEVENNNNGVVGNSVANDASTCGEPAPIAVALPAGISPLSVTQMPGDGINSPAQPVQITNGASSNDIVTSYVHYRPADGGTLVPGVRGNNNNTTSTIVQDPEEARAAYLNDIKAQFDTCVTEMAGRWTQPDGRRQQETMTFHRARALRELTSMSQTFICVRSGIQNAALSQYLRCRFTGRQERVEEKLETFISDYLAGKYYNEARETRWFRFFHDRNINNNNNSNTIRSVQQAATTSAQASAAPM